MVAINFYHLTRSTPEAALFTLLSKAYAGGHRSVVRFAHEDDVKAFDTALWVKEPNSFLPHGPGAGKHPEAQPVLLISDDTNPNKAEFAFIFPQASDGNLDFYDRVFFLFEGASEGQVKEARDRWKTLSGQGFDLTYWSQDQNGKWAKKTH